MATYYKVQSAPAPTTGRSRWKGLFSGMKQGDWFIVPKEHATRARASAHTYFGKERLLSAVTLTKAGLILKFKRSQILFASVMIMCWLLQRK